MGTNAKNAFSRYPHRDEKMSQNLYRINSKKYLCQSETIDKVCIEGPEA